MKTLRWLLLSLFCMTSLMGNAQTLQDEVQISMYEDAARTKWYVEVALENQKSNNYTAFQMDVKIPEGFVYEEYSLTAGTRLLGHTCSAHMGADGLLHVVAYSASNMEIPGNTGNLFTLSLKAKEGTPDGTYRVELQNIRFAKRDGMELQFSVYSIDFYYMAPVTGKKYDVIYYVDGQEFKRQSVTVGQKIPAVEFPVKEGHTFVGWKEIPQVMPSHDVVVNAVFTVNKYRLVTIVDGVEYQTAEIEYGAEVVLPEIPVKEGHTFSGWSEAPATMPAHEVKIVGSFTVNTYVINYYLNGEFYGSQEVRYGDPVQPLKVEDTVENIFLGWQGLPETMPAENLEIHGSTQPTGIDSLSAESEVTVYSLDGKLTMTRVTWKTAQRMLSRGVYIVNGQRVWVR